MPPTHKNVMLQMAVCILLIYTACRRPALPTQGTGWDIFVDVSPRGLGDFSHHVLDLPFTRKEIQACRLKGSTAASGQSVVCRHTRTRPLFIVFTVVVPVVVFFYQKYSDVSMRPKYQIAPRLLHSN